MNKLLKTGVLLFLLFVGITFTFGSFNNYYEFFSGSQQSEFHFSAISPRPGSKIPEHMKELMNELIFNN